MVSGMQAFTKPLAALARTPANLAAAVLGGVNSIVASVDNANSAFTLLKQVIEHLQGDTPPGSSDAAKAERALHTALVAGVVAEIANQAALADWGNSQAALAAQNTLLASMEGVLASTDDAQTYHALRDVRAISLKALAAQIQGLPQIKTITLSAPLPWLVLGQRLYPNDPDLPARADALWQRNQHLAPNPLFMPAGIPLEYIAPR